MYHNFIDQALALGTPRTNNSNRLAIDNQSEFTETFRRLNLYEPKIYERINIETKITALSSQLIIRLDRLYQQIALFGLYINFIDEGTGDDRVSYLAVEVTEATKSKAELSEIINILRG